jgi:hypothetical protein
VVVPKPQSKFGNASLLNMCIELHLGLESCTREIALNHVNSVFSSHSLHWLISCNLPYACLCEARPGCHLTTLFGYTAVMPIEVPKKKRTLLPLLIVVFLLSYGLMTMLIVEQGSVIQSQRNLITILMRDSTELWSMRGKALADQQAARTKQQNAQSPSVQTPSTQTPSTQIPSTQAPSTQAAPQNHSQSHAGKIARPQQQLPPVPASDLVDQRRALRTI